MTSTLKKLCAWCGSAMDEDGRRIEGPGMERLGPADPSLSHGICHQCVASLSIEPVLDLQELTREEYDALPFGVIGVDADGTVLTYNAWEESLSTYRRERVLGRNFFSDIAPCTQVREFRGQYLEMVADDEPARHELSFLFRLPTESRRVQIVLLWTPEPGEGMILVRDADPESDGGAESP